MLTSKKQSGFTIVELAVVIAVIGILAAITIVAYSGIQDKANDTAVLQDMSVLAKKLDIYYTFNGRYPHANIPSLSEIDYSVAQKSYDETILSNLQYCSGENYKSYAYAASSTSGKWFLMSSNDTTATEYTGPLDFTDSPCPNITSETSITPGPGTLSGYVKTSTPQWRAWTGVTQ